MKHLRMSAAAFLQKARLIIKGIRKEALIRERLKEAYNINEARLKQIEATYRKAEKAESRKSRKFGKQLGQRQAAERMFNEAKDTFLHYKTLLELTLKYDKERQKQIFLKGAWKNRSKPARLKNMLEVYNRVLDDNEVMQGVAKLGITREILEKGRQKIIAALDAKQNHVNEKGDAQDAVTLRDSAFRELDDIVRWLEKCCVYTLKDRPQLLEILGIPVLSPAYEQRLKANREKKNEKEEEEEYDDLSQFLSTEED